MWHSDLLAVYYPLLICLLLSNNKTLSSVHVLSFFFFQKSYFQNLSKTEFLILKTFAEIEISSHMMDYPREKEILARILLWLGFILQHSK